MSTFLAISFILEMIAENPVWNPTSSKLAEQEATTMNYRGELITRESTARGKFVINQVGTCDAADTKDDAQFDLALENEVAV